MKFIRRIFHSEFYRGGVFLTISAALVNILNYLFNMFAARSLGPSDFSEIITLGSYMSIFSVPMLVLNAIIIRKIGEAGEGRQAAAREMEIFFNGKLKRWWILIALSLLLSPLVPGITNMSAAAGYLLIPMIIITFLTSFYGAAIQGLKMFLIFSVISLLITIVKFAGAVLSINSPHAMPIILTFLFLSTAVTLILYYWAYRRETAHVKPNHPVLRRRILKLVMANEFTMATLSILSMTLFNNMDIILVKKAFPAADAGVYGLWTLFAKVIFYALGPILTVTYVYFTDSEKRGRSRRTLWLSLGFFLVVGVASFFAYDICAPLFVGYLGARFLPVLPLMGWASISGTLYSLIAFLNNYFMARNNRAMLIVPVMLPVYVVIFLVMPKTLTAVMILNATFSAIAAAACLFAYIKAMLYNDTHHE